MAPRRARAVRRVIVNDVTPVARKMPVAVGFPGGSSRFGKVERRLKLVEHEIVLGLRVPFDRSNDHERHSRRDSE